MPLNICENRSVDTQSFDSAELILLTEWCHYVMMSSLLRKFRCLSVFFVILAVRLKFSASFQSTKMFQYFFFVARIFGVSKFRSYCVRGTNWTPYQLVSGSVKTTLDIYRHLFSVVISLEQHQTLISNQWLLYLFRPTLNNFIIRFTLNRVFNTLYIWFYAFYFLRSIFVAPWWASWYFDLSIRTELPPHRVVSFILFRVQWISQFLLMSTANDSRSNDKHVWASKVYFHRYGEILGIRAIRLYVYYWIFNFLSVNGSISTLSTAIRWINVYCEV